MTVQVSPPVPPGAASLRRLLGSYLATVAIVAVVVGLVVALAVRFGQSPGPLDPVVGLADLVFVPWAVVAVALAIRVVRQQVRPRPRWWFPVPLQRTLSRLVEVSLFGVGTLGRWTATNPDVGLDRITPPGPVSDEPDPVPFVTDERPSARPEPQRRRSSAAPLPGRALVADDLPLVVTDLRRVDHVTGRGDTWWSLSERYLGHGRHWVAVLDENRGREVAPGVVVDDDTIVRPGWELRVPVSDAPTSRRRSRPGGRR